LMISPHGGRALKEHHACFLNQERNRTSFNAFKQRPAEMMTGGLPCPMREWFLSFLLL
jgi:hypothetical protein